MQPSKEREAADGDPLDDLDDLLDDDLSSDGGSVSGPDRDDDTRKDTRDDTRRGAGIRDRIGLNGRWFSLRGFAIALVAIGLGVFLGGMLPLIGGTIGHAAGVLLGAFLVGLVFSKRRYVETGIAGAGVGAGSALLNVLGIGFLPIGLRYIQEWGLALLAVGGGIGLVLALVGHYFGRDLRAGVTERVE
ncbi:hypothetical protein [Halorubrum vacuolatum]|uniref:Uncharacterized protein n=1 Tax=Halorubrum vacuolatum TaxID=63740 RepID=A0A238UNW5_HALVU|nr:hypothetical protein [Halorubrum vacuolatum]SNR23203.1 hypothetical protein SAMN06264855_10177 [Halorubrum vacuolatum]